MTYLLTALGILFVVGMLLRKVFPKLCALCFATSATWVLGLGYLVIYGSNIETVDVISVAILMGGSAVGSMYYLSSRVKESWNLFKLPYLVTLFAMIYIVLAQQLYVELVIGIVALWVIFFAIYLLRHTSLRAWSQKIIECCKNW